MQYKYEMVIIGLIGSVVGLALSSYHSTFQIFLNGIFSIISFKLSMRAIPNLTDKFFKAQLVGYDQGKAEKTLIPESMGVLVGAVFLINMFLFIPIFFTCVSLTSSSFYPHFSLSEKVFNQEEFSSILAALLSICCMVLLGFVDDVIDLRWLYKLLLPTIATLPLLMVYAVNYNLTSILLPKPFSFTVKLGLLYYIYMGMLAVFCTNAINIFAGINGLEVGQSIVISLSILFFNIIEMHGDYWKVHLFSFTFILPFTSVAFALCYYNWYPARVFVGDTFCYFAGMTFAVVGILGHFSKTMMLFFLPQIFNFLFSCPQLFHLVNCPRHRLPKYVSKTNLMVNSTFEYNSNQLSFFANLVLKILKSLNLVKTEKIATNTYRCTNFTLINVVLIWFGPLNEKILTLILLSFQIFCSMIAFFIRYFLVKYFYES